METIMVYIHVPFCVKKCLYCDFLSAPADEKSQSLYVDALIREMERKYNKLKDRRVKTIFIGGGTPSSLSEENLSKLLSAVRDVLKPDCETEYTMECNPGTLSESKLKTAKKYGVNRLSIGLQSMDNDELKLLGRIHSAEEFEENYLLARECGFDNINIDLISSLPGQNKEAFMNSLRKAIAMSPEHISVYSLIVEEGTEFYDRYHDDVLKRDRGEKTLFLPDEDTEYETGVALREYLKSAGYNRYEISNYALDGRECTHNKGYWQRKDYLGLGLGAASFIDKTRYKNEVNIKEYIKINGDNVIDNLPLCDEPYFEKTELSAMEEMEETMFLGLRMTEGVNLLDFKEKFGVDMKNVYHSQTEELVMNGLAKIEDGCFRLTDRGFDLGNYAFGMFLFD